MRIQTFHRYNRLVKQGLVEPLKCSLGHPLSVMADEDGNPLLRDFYCNSIVKPSINLYNEVEAKVKEHYR